MAPTTLKTIIRRAADLGPLTPASLSIIIVGCLLAISVAAVGATYWRKRRQTTAQTSAKAEDRSSSTGSEEHQLERIVGNSPSNQQPDRTDNPRYSVGMLSRTVMGPPVSSPNPDPDRSRLRTREERERAYARLSMGGIMSRASMGARSPDPRSPMSPRDPLMSAGILSRMPASPRPMGNLSTPPSPVIREGEFLEPPPRYS